MFTGTDPFDPDRPAAPRPALSADLTLVTPHGTFRVHGENGVLVAASDDCSPVRAARHLLRGDGRRSLRTLARTLERLSVRLTLRLRGRDVAVLGSGARPGILGRGLWKAPIEVDLPGLATLVSRP